MRLPAKIAWFLVWTTCVAGDCQGPPPRVETEILTGSWSDQPYKSDTRAVYKCRPGYRTLGTIVRECRNGRWEALNPNRVCQKRPCGHPGDTPFGTFRLEKEETFQYGAKAVYTCDEGYRLLGSVNFRECDADGWTNDVPLCEVVKCAPVTEPTNGKIVGVLDKDQAFSYGQVIRFECGSGFMLDGPKEIHCSTDGDWSEAVPKCVEISCKLPEVPNGSPISKKQIYKENERFQYKCNKGYTFGDRGDAICTKLGWNPSPTCKEVTCTRPYIPNGNFRPDKALYRGDDQITYGCKSTFHPATRETTVTCTSTGWVPSPRCTFMPCEFPKIRHGSLHDEERYRPYFPAAIGKSFYYSCHQDFVTPDHYYWHSVTCTQTGWEPKVPCRRKCIFSHLENGKSPWRSKAYYEGESMVPECHSGFSLPHGKSVMTCTESGWSPPPRCERIKTCSQTDIEIENGFISEPTFNYNLNQQAQFKCKVGYVTASGETSGSITCQQNGWSAQPTCVKSCDRPAFENAITKRSGTRFKLNEQLEYECKPGYENREGRTTGSIVCEQNGWSHQPTCYERECDVPKLDQYILAKPRKEKYKVGDVLKLTCKNKRLRVGPDSIQCYHFGWSPNAPTCRDQVKNCGRPPLLLNGKSTTIARRVYRHRDVVEYVCNPGFLLKGAYKVQCFDGEWTALPICIAEKRTCEDKPELVNGFSDSSFPPYYHGQSLKFNCSNNFTMIGQRSITCIYGNWTQLPECIATHELKNCTRETLFPYKPSLSDKNEFTHNENISYTCENDSGIKTSICVNGQWDPDPERNCKDKPKQVCPPPPQIPNAQIMTTTVNYQDGDKIPILCKENYLIQESEEIECKNGTWQSIPHCVEKVSCSQPPQIENGAVVTAFSSLGTEVYPHGTVLKYTCNAGFGIREEDNGITCSIGKWSYPPQCVGLPCESPPEISHGTVQFPKYDGYRYGEEVTYSCSEGYGIDGPATTICLGGKWSSPPECKITDCFSVPTFNNAILVGPKKSPYKSGDKVTFECSDSYLLDGPNFAQCINSKWIGEPTCRDVSCGDPPAVQNAVVRNKMVRYPAGERVYYECQRPFEAYGETDVQCLNGNWTKPPECKDPTGKCGPPPPIANGDITSSQLQEYASESRVEYQCQSLYKLKGYSTAVCRNGQWSEPPICLEPCVISEDIMNEHRIKLRWLDNQKLYSEYGDPVEFTCKDRYRKKTPEASFRVICKDGKIAYPTCW